MQTWLSKLFHIIQWDYIKWHKKVNDDRNYVLTHKPHNFLHPVSCKNHNLKIHRFKTTRMNIGKRKQNLPDNTRNDRV